MLYALVFAVHDCGFQARSAQEIDDAGLVRIEKLYGLIGACRFGIHDISRTELDPDNGLPRFNMPLELGIFLGATKYGTAKHKKKLSLVIDREKYRFQKYISDISGQDVKAHEEQPAKAIKRVRDWLNSSPVDPEATKPGATKMAERYDRFIEELPALCEELHLRPEEVTFNDFTTILVEWLSYNEW